MNLKPMRYVNYGEQCPHGFGRWRTDFCHNRDHVAIIPLNIILRIIWIAWQWLVDPFGKNIPPVDRLKRLLYHYKKLVELHEERGKISDQTMELQGTYIKSLEKQIETYGRIFEVQEKQLALHEMMFPEERD